MHKQIQISPGVYLTDFRKNQSIIGLTEEKPELTNDVGLLLDQVQTLEDKIVQLEYSIKEIMKQTDWQNDVDFKEAVDQNWQYIIKFSQQQKQKVLRLFQLNYHPQSDKVEDLLKITRIEEREAFAIQRVKQQLQNRSEMCKTEQKQKKEAIIVAEKINPNESKLENKGQSDKNKKQVSSEDEDGGVYV